MCARARPCVQGRMSTHAEVAADEGLAGGVGADGGALARLAEGALGGGRLAGKVALRLALGGGGGVRLAVELGAERGVRLAGEVVQAGAVDAGVLARLVLRHGEDALAVVAAGGGVGDASGAGSAGELGVETGKVTSAERVLEPLRLG